MSENYSVGDVVKILLKSGGVTGKETKPSDIQKCSNRLKEMGCPEIPAEYKDFLSMANGLCCMDFEFYGTDKFHSEYADVDDIVSVNEFLRSYGMAKITGMLAIGMAPGGYLLYDEKRRLYTQMPPLAFFGPYEEKRTYKNMEDLLEILYPYISDKSPDRSIPQKSTAARAQGAASAATSAAAAKSAATNAGTGAVKKPLRKETPRAAVGRFLSSIEMLHLKDAERGGYASLYDALMASDKNRAPSIMDERLNRYVPDVARIREIEDKYVKGQTILYAHGSVDIGRVPESNIKLSWLTKLMSEKKTEKRGTIIRPKMLIITDEYLMGIGNPKYERAEEDVFLRWSEIDSVEGVYRKKAPEDSQIQIKLKEGDYVIINNNRCTIRDFVLFKDWLIRLLTCEEAQ